MSITKTRWPVVIVLLLLALARAAECGAGAVLAVRPGDEADSGKLGYGWSSPERLSDGSTMRWIEKREGDLLLLIQEPAAYHLAVEIMPMLADRRIQQVGLYVNNRFLVEWPIEPIARFQWFETDVPSEYFQSGTNVLTIRSGYKSSPKADPRTLSLAVKQVILTSHE